MSIVVSASLSDPVIAAQSAFRSIMNAMARPGSVQPVVEADAGPKPMSLTAAAVARTLFDNDTGVWLDGAMSATAEVADWLRFHTGARITADPEDAAFALIADPDHAPPFGSFNLGTSEYPDRSTTIVMQVRSFDEGTPLVLAGPGIKGSRRLSVSPAPADLMSRLAINRGLFPRGVDLILVADGAVAALPRSVRVTIERG
jgi:alpha-D-ribose 1-methylphosphonate 5-triphosphate synthase subunit PhnH